MPDLLVLKDKKTGLISATKNRQPLPDDFINNLKVSDWERDNVSNFGVDLSFDNVREFERTKHVHRLHPYLGKFIPQLVEAFLKKYFKKDDWILDPFAGSGTTLIEANILGMNSVGVELSKFNCLIAEVKTGKYDINIVEREIRDILTKIKEFSKTLFLNQNNLFNNKIKKLDTESDYLKKWLAPRSLQEILFYKSQIDKYKYSDILKIILTRSTRSARLISHYDLARPKKPISGKYWCIKHNRYCEPINEALKFINRYSLDTIERIKEFNELRTDAKMDVIQGDTRNVDLKKYKFDGIFTSPPYVGMIDYHEQHKYAYELFKFKNNEHGEIGPMSAGKSIKAKDNYKQAMTNAFKNISKYLKKNAKIFIVVNDRDKLYPDIARDCGFTLIDIFHRPVLMRTERDNIQYSESIYYFINK